MKQYLKIGGWWIPLEAMDEENWHPATRAIAYILFVAGVFMTAYLVLSLGR